MLSFINYLIENFMKKFLISLPIQIIIALITAYFVVAIDNITLTSGLYSVALLIKEVLFVCLPLIILGCIMHAISQLPKESLFIIVALLVCVCGSNFLSSIIAYSYVNIVDFNVVGQLDTSSSKVTLSPLYNFKLPQLIRNEFALLFGLVLAIYNVFNPNQYISKITNFASKFTNILLYKFIIPLLPFFIGGFAVKMFYEGQLLPILINNKSYLLQIFALIVCYLALLFLIAARFRPYQSLLYFKNALPPVVMAFVTMSSFAAMPLSIHAACSNTKNTKIANLTIPATVNIHLIGDSIFIPMMAIIILQIFGMDTPTLLLYLQFAGFFVLSKFAVAAIPGGGIIVMLPLLESLLGYSGEMSILITTIYMLLDPLITSANVLGNNVFVIIFNKLFGAKILPSS